MAMVHSRFSEDTAEQPVPPAPTPSSDVAQAPNMSTNSAAPTDERWFAALGYIPFVFFLPMIMKPQSRFCQLHARQGLAVTIFFFLMVFIVFIPLIGPFIGSFLFIIEVGVIAIAMFQALSGIPWKMPLIGMLADHIPVQMLEKATNAMSDVATKAASSVADTATKAASTVGATAVKAASTVADTATKAVDTAVTTTTTSKETPAPSPAPAEVPAKKENGTKHAKK